jgi:hypothetical protein
VTASQLECWLYICRRCWGLGDKQCFIGCISCNLFLWISFGTINLECEGMSWKCIGFYPSLCKMPENMPFDLFLLQLLTCSYERAMIPVLWSSDSVSLLACLCLTHKRGKAQSSFCPCTIPSWGLEVLAIFSWEILQYVLQCCEI